MLDKARGIRRFGLLLFGMAAGASLVLGSVLGRLPASGATNGGGDDRGDTESLYPARAATAGYRLDAFLELARSRDVRTGGTAARSSQDGQALGAVWALPGPVVGPGAASGRILPHWGLAPEGLPGLPVSVGIGGRDARWLLTNARTAVQLLDALGVQVARTDRIRPSPGAELSPGMDVEVVRIREKRVRVVRVVPYSTVTRYSVELSPGAVRVVTPGRPGLVARTFRVTYRNGREVRRALVSEVVKAVPVSRVVEKGAYVSAPVAAPPPPAGSNVVVSAAYSVVGVPYRWGGTSPSTGFDCSGLTMWAWARAGVTLPHSSGAQYGATSRVAQSDLRPGDLLFFYSPISHVGIYVGGGKMVHAPNSGAVVRVSTLAGYWWSVYVGAGRPR